MGLFGKVLGGTIGMAVGGPPGAIAGVALGHAFDKNDLDIDDGSYKFTIIKDNQSLFLSNIFTLFAHICVIDNKNVSRRKVSYLENFIETKLNFETKKRNILVRYFNDSLKTEPDLNKHNEFFEEYLFYEEITFFIIKSLIEFSLSNDDMDIEVGRFIKSVSEKLEVQQSKYEELLKNVKKRSYSPYAILDCKKTDDIKTVTKQYRKLVSRYHPDKNNNTIEKFLKIQDAYENIKKIRSD